MSARRPLRAFTRIAGAEGAASPPRAERRPLRIAQHGQERIDPYAWLRAANWREANARPLPCCRAISARIWRRRTTTPGRSWSRCAACRSASGRRCAPGSRKTTPPPRRPTGRFPTTQGSWPAASIRCSAAGTAGGAETVLLDGNLLAEGRPYCRIAACAHSPDHRLIAYTVDLSGSEDYRLAFRDARERPGPRRQRRTERRVLSYGANDSRTVFYTVRDDNARPRWVYRRSLGGAARTGLRRAGPRFLPRCRQDRKRPVHPAGFARPCQRRNPAGRCRPAAGPAAPRPPPAGPMWNMRWETMGAGLLILANDRGGRGFPHCPPRRSTPRTRTPGKTWCPTGRGRLILQLLLFRDWIVRLEREDGLPRIVVRAADSGEEHAIAFDEEAYALGLLPGFEYATDMLRFSYASPTTPAHVYDYDMARRTRRLLRRQEVPSGHDPADYRTRRLAAAAADGEAVPVTLLYRADLDFSQPPPCLLYGYGAYGISIPAGFSTSRLSLVDRGFVYAIAHIRGGTDRGYRWYRARQARRQGQQLRRLHRRGPPPGGRRLCRRHCRPWRQRGRAAGRRGGQPRAGALPGGAGRGCRSSMCSTPCPIRPCR